MPHPGRATVPQVARALPGEVDARHGGVLRDSNAVKSKREEGPTPAGGAHSLITWDDETGGAGIVVYDQDDQSPCRRDWRMHQGPPTEDRVVGEVTAFDADGLEPIRRSLRRAPVAVPDAEH